MVDDSRGHGVGDVVLTVEQLAGRGGPNSPNGPVTTPTPR